MLEVGCAMDNSGRVNAAPVWISQCQARAEIKFATGHPIDDEHGTGTDRTAQLGSDLRMLRSPLHREEHGSVRASCHACGWAKRPKGRMQTKPLGGTWIRNRRRNSSEETVVLFCLP